MLRPELQYGSLSIPDKADWTRAELNRIERPLLLLILDNAAGEESVMPWIPKTGNSHTLITSRFTAWSTGIENCPVGLLEPEAASMFLQKRSHRDNTLEERTAARALAEKMKNLPLALEQAAAFILRQPAGFGLSDYLQLYQANEQELLAERSLGSTEYPTSVWLTWRASIDQMPQGARAIMRLHSFLAATPFPIQIYIQGVRAVIDEALEVASSCNERTDVSLDNGGELAVRKWVAILADYSMIRLEVEDCFSMHPLVQVVSRHGLDQSTGKRMVELLLDKTPEPSVTTTSRRLWDKILPHAELLSGQFRTEAQAFLRTRTSMAYFYRGNYKRASLVLSGVLEFIERSLGSKHDDTFKAIMNLATTRWAIGDYAESKRLLGIGLKAAERTYGWNDPLTLTLAHNFAASLRDVGDYARAARLHRRVLRARESLLGSDDLATLESVHSLAVSLFYKKEYSGAEPLLRRAVAGRQRLLGEEHCDTAHSLSSLGCLLLAKRDAGYLFGV